ncbi:hypothetical protein EON63_24225 [archaeon]|nr:MAG: hypothetical protein EON63_24225 [archaeon]
MISRRLFRENCVFYDGHYVKDLSLLGRDISQTIIVDNAPTSYIFHPGTLTIHIHTHMHTPFQLWHGLTMYVYVHGLSLQRTLLTAPPSLTTPLTSSCGRYCNVLPCVCLHTLGTCNPQGIHAVCISIFASF